MRRTKARIPEQMNTARRKPVRPIDILTEARRVKLREHSNLCIVLRVRESETSCANCVRASHLENCTGKDIQRATTVSGGHPVRGLTRALWGSQKRKSSFHLNSLRNEVMTRTFSEKRSRGKIKRRRAQGGCQGTDCRRRTR